MIITALPLKLNVQKAGIVLTAPPNILGMLMELLGCSEQLNPFCGSLIIVHSLMAWMFQQLLAARN